MPRPYRGSPPTRQEVFDVAKHTVEVLKKCGLKCCLFGSAACAAYGTSAHILVSFPHIFWFVSS
ncbi:hypothetical protein SERLADRAFT_401951, partial [Serpula lacrymans var. lacrymans S7.9]